MMWAADVRPEGGAAGTSSALEASTRAIILSAYRTTRLSPLSSASCQRASEYSRSGNTQPCLSPERAARSTAMRAARSSPIASAQRPTTRFNEPVTKASGNLRTWVIACSSASRASPQASRVRARVEIRSWSSTASTTVSSERSFVRLLLEPELGGLRPAQHRQRPRAVYGELVAEHRGDRSRRERPGPRRSPGAQRGADPPRSRRSRGRRTRQRVASPRPARGPRQSPGSR